MKVYRYVTALELQRILDGDKSNIGTVFSDGPYSNSHNYKDNVKYLHFFLKKKSIQYIKPFYKDFTCDFYIATFDIPVFTLLHHAGNGKYYPLKGGFNVDIESKIEFAVPVDKFETNFLMSYELDNEHRQKIQNEQEEIAQSSLEL